MLEWLVALVLIYIYYIQFSHGVYPLAIIDEIKFQAGDIILFKAQNNFNAVWTGSYYTHMGIVYEHNGELLIFEANGLENMPARPHHFKTGILLTRLLPRIKQYKGRVFIKQIGRPLSDEQNAKFADFIQFASAKFYYDTRVIHRRIQTLIGRRTVDYRTDCGEMLYCLLVKLGMLARVDTILHLHVISQLAAVTGNWYGAPIELKHYPYELYQGHPATRSAFASKCV
jgi:hypothetical protein